MKELIYRFIIIFILFTFIPTFCFFGTHKVDQQNYKIVYIKDLNPKSFIILCKERYNTTPINSVTMAGEFPDNWVQPKDVQYLISIIHSKEKCCGYMNILSSHISKDDAEIGGFAIIFLNSYINKTKINLGLNSYPITDKESIKKIENWYKKTAK